MKAWQEDHIRENKYELCKLINLEGEGALTALESRILSGEDVDQVKIALDRKGRIAGSSKLLDLLVTRTNAYEWLMAVLKKLGQTKAYEILEKGLLENEPEVVPQQREAQQSTVSNPTCQLRQAEPTSKDGDQNDWHGDVLDGIEEVEVIRPKTKMAFADDHYELPTTGKGLALIVNIITFNNPKYNRTSAKKDSQNLTDLFRQLGYEVYNDNGVLSKETWTDEEIRKVVLAFQKRCQRENVKSIIIYIGTHGIHEKLLSSNEKLVVYWQDIISKFNTEACPKLEKKPKVFLIQACQIFASDNSGGDGGKKVEDDIKRKMNHYALVQSTIPGEYSYRIDGVGAAMVHFLTKFLMKKASSKTFQDVIRMVDQDVAASCDGQTLRMELERLEPLYFNLDPMDD